MLTLHCNINDRIIIGVLQESRTIRRILSGHERTAAVTSLNEGSYGLLKSRATSGHGGCRGWPGGAQSVSS